VQKPRHRLHVVEQNHHNDLATAFTAHQRHWAKREKTQNHRDTIIMLPRSPIVFSMMVSDKDSLLVGGFNQLEKY